MMSDKLHIRNWEKWQSYRSDRGAPPWIKIHRQLMHDENWVELTDAQRGQLVAIWLLAGCHDGVIPASPKTIQKLCHLDTEPDINLLIQKGFIDDVNVTSTGCQVDVNLTPQKRGEENRERGENDVTDVFKGTFVKRVTEKSMQELQVLCPHLTRTELLKELSRCDAYYSEQEKPPKSWWWVTKAWLERSNKRLQSTGYQPNPALKGVIV